ncbi:MAG: zinc ribbon domain-containing protein [Acidobacteriota bacterium]|nr:zinc ribbon domain-containing protein [Acidobacteriota bacterium]
MPIYEYECTGCGNRSEILQRMNDPAPDRCGECGEALKRLLSAPSFQFKGTGWYVTDYADKSDPKATKSGTDASDTQSEAKTGGGSGSDESSSSGDRDSSSTDKSVSSNDKASKTSDKPSSSGSA